MWAISAGRYKHTLSGYCDDDPTIPRTTNALDQYFGVARHHERQTTSTTTTNDAESA